MSKRFLGYLLLILLTYSLYSFTTYQELLYILILLLAIPVASFLLLLLGRYFVQINLYLENDQIYRTEKFKLYIEIENKSPFYFPLIKIEFNKPKNDISIRNFQGKSHDNLSKDEEYLNNLDQGKFSNINLPNHEYKSKGSSYIFRLYRKPHLVKSDKLISFALPQNSLVEHNLDLIATNKGLYYIGTDSILLQDLFSFFYLPLPKTKRKIKNSNALHTLCELNVYPNPKIWKANESRQLKDPDQVLMSTDNRKVSSEIDTLANVRDYQRGDRMKQIHWKLSSRSEKWLTREFEDPRQGGILFALDPKMPDSCVDPASYNNDASEILAANMKLLAKSEGPLNLILEEKIYTSPGEGIEPLNFYKQLMYWQSQIKTSDKRLENKEFKFHCNIVEIRTELQDIIQKECKNKIYRAVIICTARIHDNLLNEIIRLQKSGSQVILLFMHNEKSQSLKNYLQYIQRADIKVIPYRINSLSSYITNSENFIHDFNKNKNEKVFKHE